MYELFPVFEISAESTVAGRRHIKMVLHEIHPDEQHFQENGISWNEQFVLSNLQSVVGMSIVVEFLTEDRDIPYGHGMTEIKDNMPLFEDATVVGHCDDAYVDDIEIDGVTKRVLVAEGTLDEMRYPKFISWLREHMAEGTVKGSVEIVGKQENNGRIIYSDGWKEQGRVPQIYDYSGYAILGVKPADEAAIVMELNNKFDNKEDGHHMTEEQKKELMAAISTAASETNSKMDEYWAKADKMQAEIEQLRADAAKKEADMAQLKADYESEVAAKSAAEAGLTEANAAKEAAETALAEANAKITELQNERAKSELNAALAPYTEEQRAIAKEDIDAFNENPGSIEINTIVGKICTEMVRVSREKQVSEQNAANDIDIFGGVEDVQSGEDQDDIQVF